MAVRHANPSTISSLCDQAAQYVLRRRYRTRLLGVLALAALTTCWLLYGTSDVQRTDQARHRSFTIPKAHEILDGASARLDWVRAHPGRLIPANIWQIMLPKVWGEKFLVKPDKLKHTATWLAMNPDYAYTLVGPDGAKDFVNRHFGHNETIVSTFNALPNVGMKSDLLRYLILYIEGGVYTDTDTVALKPIDDWIPKPFRKETRLVVGIEFDQRDGAKWTDILHEVQFCQWTIAAVPGHRVFEMMTSRVIRSWQDLKRKHNVDTASGTPSSKLSSFEVMNSTGPAAWTDVVWEYIQGTDDTLTDIRNLSSLGPPKLFGDVLVLPIDGFGMGQSHSGSTNNGTIPDGALAKHLFGGTWREKKHKGQRQV
ncbi:uncharacterized protein PpBr36_10775 [Pyricularia pennisetigena]|uniref:uncharacterized protein n=1 Tax=Pyricularia pennisetigena TaxID=1578925 RepID=UPI001150BAAA|nr:uncharacterized protein PpBr36_10775 [Pyricularia pennisetigena]TLS20898.1 hypothetical protein PpBr36_10775 [Pyricularia pennisetigena]